MNKVSIGLFAVVALASISIRANAQVTLTSGAGSAVTSVDRIATFDNVTTGTNLNGYTEGNLIISVPGTAYEEYDPTFGAGGFNGHFHYPSGGAFAATAILAQDGADLKAIEFNIGTGFFSRATDFHYFVFNNGVPLGDSYFTAPLGSVVGFIANVTVDEIRIGAYNDTSTAQAATTSSFQALALDNLKVQTTGGATVPEPGTCATLAGLGVTGLGFAIRRRRA